MSYFTGRPEASIPGPLRSPNLSLGDDKPCACHSATEGTLLQHPVFGVKVWQALLGGGALAALYFIFKK